MPAFDLYETGSEFRRRRSSENQDSELNTASIIESHKFELHNLSVDALFDLRDQITRMLLDRVQNEQRELESRMARLRDVSVSEMTSVPARRKAVSRPSRLKGRKIPAKYRNPVNPSETWAGRGRLPKWLAAALDEGKQLLDFQIVGDADVSYLK